MSLKITPIDSSIAVFDRLETKEHKLCFNNLQLFKRLLEMSKTGLHYHPYTMKKSGIHLYRAIFFALGLFLSFLSMYIHSTSYNFLALHLLSMGHFAKILITSISGSLALLAFIIAAKMTPHRELVSDTIKKARKKGHKLFVKKLFFLRYQKVVEHAEIDDAKASWNFLYEDFLEYLETEKERTLLLVERVHIAKTLTRVEKEQLFNEALFELEENLKKAIVTFRAGKSPA